MTHGRLGGGSDDEEDGKRSGGRGDAHERGERRGRRRSRARVSEREKALVVPSVQEMKKSKKKGGGRMTQGSGEKG